MKTPVHPRKLLVAMVLVGPCLALAQATGPSGFSKKFYSPDAKPGLHSGHAVESLPNIHNSPGAWLSCNKQDTLIVELEKTLALQTKRIDELEAAVKIAAKGGK